MRWSLRSLRDPVRVHLLRIGAPDRTRPKPRDDDSKRLRIWAVTRSPRLTRRFESQLVARGNIAWVGVFTRQDVPKAIFAAAFIRQPIRVALTMRNLLPDGHR